VPVFKVFRFVYGTKKKKTRHFFLFFLQKSNPFLRIIRISLQTLTPNLSNFSITRLNLLLMKKWFTGLFMFVICVPSFAQDDAILAAPLGTIMAPTTGCALTSTEAVTVRIFNSGPGTIMAPFDVSFNITGPVNSSATETVLVGSIPMNSTFTYTFTATADLSTTGTYTMDATVTVAGDPNASNDTYTGYSITNNSPSNGGTATGGANVCSGSNSGNVTLVGQVGNVLNWEYSTDMGGTWISISNTTTSQAYNNLTVQTWYRANVQNSTCAVATSTTAKMIIDPVSVGGTTAGGTTPTCSGSNSGTITLSGKVGNVLNWEYSIDGGATYTPIVNTTTSNPYSNILVTTRYRAVVKSGVCPSVISGVRIITVNPTTVGGTVTANATVCSGANAGTLTLAGQTGTVQNWESSTDGGMTWTPIVNTTTSQNYLNLLTTTMYRAIVKSGTCPSAASAAATITVVPNSVGGTISSSMTVCNAVNDDTLVLSGFSGSILDWENSTDGGMTWTPIGTTNDSLFFNGLVMTTAYRAIVQAGACATANSTTATVTVDATSVGGTLSSDATVCASGNGGTITLAGQTGTPSNWEYSDDGGASWNPIANTTLSQNYTNLLLTTMYRSNVQNGTCAGIYSDTVTITVDPVTVGGTINSNAVLCSGNNTGTLNLVGETGAVTNWESSTDGGFTWVSIANITTSQGYLNIATNTQYRAIVQSGVCPGTQSAIATLTVDQPAVGGTIFGSTTVCEGANSGALTLLSSNGSVMDWETSTDGGMTWTPVGNTSTIENFNNLILTTDYRAILTSGVCPNDTSATGTITVDATTVAGAVTSDAIVCEISNSGILGLSGHTGTVLNWEMSTDGGSTWITLANNTIFQNYINLTTTTSYRAKVQNGVCSAIGSAPAMISVQPQTVPGAVNSSATVCEGLNFGILSLTGHAGLVQDWEFSDDAGATWTSLSNSTINQTYSNLVDTTWYRAIVQNGICPADTSSVAFINLYPAPDASFLQDTVCSGTAINFVNGSTSSAGFITFHSWDFGDGNTSTSTNPSHNYAAAGSYNALLFVMNNFGCSDTVSHLMQVDATPVVDITAAGPLSFCEGDSVQISSTFDINYTYVWNVGAITNSITVDSSYNYMLVATDITNGCTAIDSVEVIVFALPVADAGLDTMVDLGFSTVLTGSGGVSYAWTPVTGLDNPFSANPSASPVATTTYTLTVTDMNNCSSSDSVVVTLSDNVVITVRNIITPNGDNFNDVWYIENILNFPNNTVSVYNRYGQKVYEANAYVNDWDGTFNGDPLPDGSYYYVVELTDTDEVFKGAINIVSSN
jgi:gliding motility-associated-like protein